MSNKVQCVLCSKSAHVLVEWSGIHKGVDYSSKLSSSYPTVGWCAEHDLGLSFGPYAHNRREVSNLLTSDDFFKEFHK